MRFRDMVSWQTETGERVVVGDVELAPQSRALTVRWPSGGWVWNRPVAVLVGREGQRERIPIVDVTRTAQVGLLGLGALFSMVTLFLTIKKRRH